MLKNLENIKSKFKAANIVEQLIIINILIFIISFLIKGIASLMLKNDQVFFDWFALSASGSDLLTKPWTIFTYGFLHGDFFHILFNLLVLYYIGALFLNFFSKRDLLTYYFLGIIFGGMIYLLSYSYFPALRSSNSYLVGASAGVTAVLVGLATKIPNYSLIFRFIGAIKLWYIALAFVVLDIVQLPISNTGGHLAHLGGALIGFILTKYFIKNKDSTSILDLFKRKKHKPLKTVYKNPGASQKIKDSNAHQRKIDEILDKISKSGYESLNTEEKDYLFKAGKE